MTAAPLTLAASLGEQRDEQLHGSPRETKHDIARRVAEQHKLTIEQLCGPSRLRRIVRPRQQAMAEMRETGRYSTTQIGQFFGGRDHTTVMHATRRHAERGGQTDAR